MRLNWRRLIEPWYAMFFRKNDPEAYGRKCVISVNMLSGIVGQLTGSTFYTAFLINNGIDITRIGILTFIPYIASMLSVFSPVVLEPFAKRKGLLVGARVAYYLINILGITLIPYIFSSMQAKLIGFVTVVFVSTVINAVTSPGLSVWHIRFIPPEMRANYFSVSQFLINFVAYAVCLISSIIADSMSGTSMQMTILIIYRIIGLALAMWDCYLCSRPHEFEYEHGAKKLNPMDSLGIPLRNKKFTKTMFRYYIYSFGANLTAGVMTTYSLQNMNFSYSLINGINSTYFLFFLILGKFWGKMVKRVGWLRTFSIALFMDFFPYILWIFIRPETTFLYVILRLCQHALGVGLVMGTSNLVYMNMPPEDQTTYMSFHTIMANAVAFAGCSLGTLVVGLTGDRTILGLHPVVFLVVCGAFVSLFNSFFVWKTASQCEDLTQLEKYDMNMFRRYRRRFTSLKK